MQTNYDFQNPLFVSSEILLGSQRAADELGEDLTPSLSFSGIEAGLVVSPKGVLAIHQVVNFLNHAADQFNCPHFGFLVGQHQPPLRFGLIGQLPKFASSVEEAIGDLLSFSLLNSEFSLWEMRQEHDLVSLVRHNRVAYNGSLVQLQTLAVTVVFKALVSLCGAGRQVSQISFTHSESAAKKLFDRFYNAPTCFNSEFNGIIFPEEFLRLPIDTADPKSHATLMRYLESVRSDHQPNDEIGSKVQRQIKQSLGGNMCTLEGVAHLLGQSPRGLQRELQRQGITYRELLVEVRQDVAEHYLRSSAISLVELSDILGYRNVSAFSRAFKKSSGLSPEHWKRVHA